MAIVTLDFETYYSKDYTLSKLTTEAYVNDSQFQVIGFAYSVDGDTPVWVTGTDEEIAEQLHALNLQDHYLLAHNTAFDGAILAWRYLIKPKYYLDTMSMARPITGLTVGGSLAALAKLYELGEKGTEVVEAKGLRREDFPKEQLDQYGAYCCNDVLLTYKAYQRLSQLIPQKEQYVIDLLLRMYCDPVLELDPQVLTYHFNDQKESRKFALAELAVYGITEDTVMSNPKFADALRAMGVEPPMKISPATGKPTYAFAKTDQGMKDLLNSPNPTVVKAAEVRLKVKSSLEMTRAQSLLDVHMRMGKLPVPLTYYGGHTGRASGWDSINLQNLPRGGALRQSIRAPKDHALVAVDSSQIEARMTAWFAGETQLVQDFANGVDIYSKFASEIYDYPVDKSKKVERFVGKTCILGLGYGMGPDKFQIALRNGAISVSMEANECKRIVSIYRTSYAKIVALWNQAQQCLRTAVLKEPYKLGDSLKLEGTEEGIHLPNGMMIRYPDLKLTDDKKSYLYMAQKKPVFLHGPKVVENVVQALARIVVFDQMCRINQQLKSLDTGNHRYRVVSTVHDEVIACVPRTYAEECMTLMEVEMSKAPKWANGLPVACEGAYGATYFDCK